LGSLLARLIETKAQSQNPSLENCAAVVVAAEMVAAAVVVVVVVAAVASVVEKSDLNRIELCDAKVVAVPTAPVRDHHLRC
jgi:hypothetical protein